MGRFPSQWFSGFLALAWSLISQPGLAQPPPEKVDLTGTLVAEDTGEPIKGATLTLRPASNSRPGGYSGGQATSDEAGKFLFPRVAEGAYELRVRAEGFRTLQQTLRVQGSQPAPLELVLPPLPVLTGRLLRPDGTPLNQVEVQVYLSIYGITPDTFGQTGSGPRDPLITGPTGQYRVPLKSSGRATIVFLAPEVGWGGFSFAAPEGEDLTGPELTLSPLVSVQGQVRRQGTGEPIQKANVSVDIAGGPGRGTVTDEEGRFAFPHLLSGTIRLTASAPGYLASFWRIPADPGEEVTDVICELRPNPSLRGRLLDPNGKPLAEVTAQVSLARHRAWNRFLEGNQVETDGEGWFTVTLPEPGRYAVQVQVPDLGWAFGSWFTADEEEPQVERDFVVRPLPTVSGMVRDRESQQPVPSASIRLQHHYFDPQGLHPQFGQTQEEVSTDADGQFTLEDVAPGSYRLRVSAEGFLSKSLPSIIVRNQPVNNLVVELSPQTSLTGRVVEADGVTPIAGATVSEGRQQTTTDAEGRFHLTDLWPQTALAVEVQAEGRAPLRHRAFVVDARDPGEVTLTLAYSGATLGGQVWDTEGKPLPGASVVVWDRGRAYLPDLSSLDRNVQEGRELPDRWEIQRTDDAGRYQFTHLAEGEYRVGAAAPGRVPAQCDGLVLREGEEVLDLDFTLPLLPPEPGETAQARRRVRLQLLQPDGEPLAFESVRVDLEFQSPHSNRGTGTSLTTDDQGSLVFPLRDEEGTYHLLLEPQGYRPIWREHLERSAEEEIIHLEEAVPVEIRGQVWEPEGIPAAGVTVVPFAWGREFPQGELVTSYHNIERQVGWKWAGGTDAEGRFRLGRLDPGVYGLYFIPSADGEGKVALPPMFGPWVDVVGPTEVGEVTLVPGGTVRGRVVSSAGRPLPEVPLQIYTPWDDHHFMGRFRYGKTDAEGYFQVEGLPEGTYGIAASLPGEGRCFLDDLFVGRGRTVENLRLRLQRPRYGRLQGQVWGPDGRTPAAQARVLLLNSSGNSLRAWQVAEPEGHFGLNGLSPGRYWARAWKAGYALSPPVEVVIEPERTTGGIQLVLQEGGVVQGRVLPPPGETLPSQVQVAILPPGVGVGILHQGGVSLSGLVRVAVPDAEGGFVVEDVPPGPQQVFVEVDGTVRAGRNISVTAGDRVETELRLTATDGVITGSVADEEGNPLEYAKVWASLSWSAPQQYRTATDRHGRFLLEDLPRDTYRVFAEADGRANLTVQEVAVTGETPAEVTFRLSKGGGIAGRVVGPKGQPVFDAEVRTEASGRRWEPPENGLTLRRTRTDEAGSFELTRLAPGTYHLTVQPEGQRPQTSAPVTVRDGETTPLEIRLEAGPGTE